MATKLSTQEAALLVGISRERLIRAFLTGRIHGELLGGRYFIDRASLEAFVAELQPPRAA
jgi:excisionase family DNA binding protein